MFSRSLRYFSQSAVRRTNMNTKVDTTKPFNDKCVLPLVAFGAYLGGTFLYQNLTYDGFYKKEIAEVSEMCK